ncbi:MAG: PspC domain-containing protein [Anaerolineae bacterium]|nr:PspC domain-containing protein [Anaerolineae bacterium]
MYRSFTDRVFGGVCGGLAALLPVNAWVFRAIFVIAALLTSGAFALLYLLFWWMLPQESLVGRQRGGAGRLLLVIVLTATVSAGWVAAQNGALQGPSGRDLFWPGMLLALALVYFFRQVRG